MDAGVLPTAPANSGAPADSSAPAGPRGAEVAPTAPVDGAASTAPAAAKPRTLCSWLGPISTLEKFSCALILLGVFAFCALVFVPALLDFPEETQLMAEDDFPIKGQWVEVSSASTYWRRPVSEGQDADTVRAGTRLIPIVDLELSGKGRIRLIFRDSDGKAVGDPIVRDVGAKENWSAACTAGLIGSGDFAAYQMGELQAWCVELYETAADEDSMLFKMNISPTLK